MPLKWQPGINPYMHTYFAKLRAGPNVRADQLIQQCRELKKLLAAGKPVTLDSTSLDEHALSEAATKLTREPAALAQELLLVHPQPKDEGKKLKRVCAELRQASALDETREPLPLAHPLAILWFTPPPAPDVIGRPDWREFGFVESGDEQDLALDIVFDEWFT